MLITRRIEFSASHRCASPDLDEAGNRAVYAEEANPRGHGHNYVLEVTLEGDPDPVTGMVIDLKDVKTILEAEIVHPMDPRHLNHEVPPFDRVVPTAENLAVEIWRRLAPRFAATPARLHSIRLHEGSDLFVDYEGAA
jgi:6-pyruvoyltetrahydropterin/6-carboxytetrahydropterin synthase